jgi:DNA-binding MarR family transcriptional regulator
VTRWTDALPYSLFRANQAVHRLVTEAIEGMGVTITQLGITVHLDELGHMSGSDLARRFKITPQSSSTALARLEALEWVRRVPHPYHGRVIWYEVTDAGHAAAVEGRKRLARLHQELTELLGDQQMESAISSLTAITVAIDGPEPSLPTAWPALKE